MFGPCYLFWFLVSPSLCLILVMCLGSWCPLVCVWSLLCFVGSCCSLVCVGSCYALWCLVSFSLCLVLFMCCGSLCPLNCVSCFLLCVVVLGVP